MSDSEPINDIPSKEEVVTELPYYDDASAPTPQMINNYNKPQNNNNDISSQDNLQQGNENSTPKLSNDYEPNNNIEKLVPVRRVYRFGENPRILKLMSIILILIFIIDIFLEISLRVFSPLVLADDFAILTMAIIYLIFIAKKKSTNHPALGAATVFVWFVGFGAKGIGMAQGGNKAGFIVPLFFLNAARTFAMFMCIPPTCNNH